VLLGIGGELGMLGDLDAKGDWDADAVDTISVGLEAKDSRFSDGKGPAL
jgi:hypothetical protein